MQADGLNTNTRMADGRAMPTTDQLGSFHLTELLRVDRYSTAAAVGGLAVILAVTAAKAPWLWVLMAWLAAMCVVRQLGLLPLRRGFSRVAVMWFALGSWGAAVGAVLLIPRALPVVIITMGIPAVLSAIYQSDREVQVMTVALVFAVAGVGAIASWTDGAGIEDELHPDVIAGTLVVYMAAQTLPLVQAVRHSSAQFRAALNEVRFANGALEEARQQVVDSRKRLARAADRERRKIERDLHDGAQQRLVSTLVQLRVADQLAANGKDLDRQTFGTIADSLELAIDELRSLARGIYPSLLQTSGVVEALRGLSRVAAIPTRVEADLDGRLPSEVETAFYFVASEALQNAAKHAGPDASATIRIAKASDGARLEIRDNGRGFESDGPVDVSTSTGLLNMTDRVGAIGGQLEVRSALGQGCHIMATVPSEVFELEMSA